MASLVNFWFWSRLHPSVGKRINVVQRRLLVAVNYSLPLPLLFLRERPSLASPPSPMERWQQQWPELSSVATTMVGGGWRDSERVVGLGWVGLGWVGGAVRRGWGGRSGLHRRREEKAACRGGRSASAPMAMSTVAELRGGRKRRSSTRSLGMLCSAVATCFHAK
jgi:hypothetical protein